MFVTEKVIKSRFTLLLFILLSAMFAVLFHPQPVQAGGTSTAVAKLEFTGTVDGYPTTIFDIGTGIVAPDKIIRNEFKIQITLTGATWNEDEDGLGSKDNQKAFIDAFKAISEGSGNESLDCKRWKKVKEALKDALDNSTNEAGVFEFSVSEGGGGNAGNNVLIITVPGVEDYFLAADQTITIDTGDPGASNDSGLGYIIKDDSGQPVKLDTSFTIEAAPKVIFSGYEFKDTEIEEGKKEIVITLVQTKWVDGLDQNPYKLEEFIDAFKVIDGSGEPVTEPDPKLDPDLYSDYHKWEKVKEVLKTAVNQGKNPFKVSDSGNSILTITLPRVENYFLFGDQIGGQTVNLTVPFDKFIVDGSGQLGDSNGLFVIEDVDGKRSKVSGNKEIDTVEDNGTCTGLKFKFTIEAVPKAVLHDAMFTALDIIETVSSGSENDDSDGDNDDDENGDDDSDGGGNGSNAGSGEEEIEFTITLVKATWNTGVVNNVELREKLIASLQPDIKDENWDDLRLYIQAKGEVKIDNNNNKILTITFPKALKFEIKDTIKVRLFDSLSGSGDATKYFLSDNFWSPKDPKDPVPAYGAITIIPTYAGESVIINPSVLSAADIKAGKAEFSLLLSGEKWAGDLSGSDDQKKTKVINNIIKGFKVQDQQNEWKLLSTALAGSEAGWKVTGNNKLTITVPAVPAYDIIRDQEVEITIPKAALEGKDNILAGKLTIKASGLKGMGKLTSIEECLLSEEGGGLVGYIGNTDISDIRIIVPPKYVETIKMNTLETGDNVITTVELLTAPGVKEAAVYLGNSEPESVAPKKGPPFIFVFQEEKGGLVNEDVNIDVFDGVGNEKLQSTITRKIPKGNKVYNELPKKRTDGFYSLYLLLTDKSLLKNILKDYLLEDLKISKPVNS